MNLLSVVVPLLENCSIHMHGVIVSVDVANPNKIQIFASII